MALIYLYNLEEMDKSVTLTIYPMTGTTVGYLTSSLQQEPLFRPITLWKLDTQSCYLTAILRNRIGYHLIDSLRDAKRRVACLMVINYETEKDSCIII